ncbi:MAG: ATP-binding protein [Coriobacteriaceae bacterium]|nr:ATP-binding protein [Coriobacteriaceae bacterium]
MAKEYLPRIYDKVLARKLEAKGAVLIEGPKWCGKTTTALQQAKSVLYMQDPETRSQNLMMADIHPTELLRGDTPRLIDEWQIAPKLWDAVRFEVDRRDEFEQFILTGSSVPVSLDEKSHTGTGRISRMRMRPMSLFESGDSTGTISLGALLDGNELPVSTCSSTIQQIAFLTCRGGWPKAIGQTERIALQQAFDYLDAVADIDISSVDGTNRDPRKAKALMRSYARLSAQQATLSSIEEDMKGSDLMSINTIRSYVDALSNIFVTEDLTAWNPNLRSKTAIRTSPTRHFVDSSIATAALGLGPADLMNDLNTFGFIFESLCVRDLRTYADALDGEVFHYRDKSGLECDAVIHLRDGSYGLVEIKLGGDTAIEQAATSLIDLRDKIDTEKMRAPAFCMILIGAGDYSYTRPDGVMVVPVTALRP